MMKKVCIMLVLLTELVAYPFPNLSRSHLFIMFLFIRSDVSVVGTT